MEQKGSNPTSQPPIKALLIVYSYHHMNTEKVANVFASVLGAQVKMPQRTDLEELQDYDLIGFGSGIDSGKHYKELIGFTDHLPPAAGKKAFIFSTSAILGADKVAKDHATLREKLQAKGYVIVDEFACKGFNTNSFLKYIGGMNRGRPNAEDLRQAEEFALGLRRKMKEEGR
ncbi:flavodoxin family protein [Methanocella sp. MCL-LM]|uniref:flavodoxin family protein n=1 Tax=Methanocella sp. MCL-LM TaxID=3412035 RepID=UPI003C73E33D